MIKALAGPYLILGITKENVERLAAGNDVHIDLTEMGSPKFTKIAICYRDTVEQLMAVFEPHVTPDTQIHGKEN